MEKYGKPVFGVSLLTDEKDATVYRLSRAASPERRLLRNAGTGGKGSGPHGRVSALIAHGMPVKKGYQWIHHC
jgi:hypothetical protein